MKNYIKAARENSGKTQKECSDALNISLRAWQGYEQGIREPKFELLCKIADLFNVTTDYLLGRETKAPEPNPFTDMNLDEDDEKEVIAKYMSLPPEVRAMMLDVLLQLADVARSRKQPNAESNGNSGGSSIQQSESALVCCGTVGEELECRERAKAEQSKQKLSEPIVQSASQNLSQPVQPQQTKVEQPWRMAARSTDGKYVSRTMTPEEVELIESLEDVPKSRY
ncbi:MAG: helix-turn-helix domain-containing protein [Oscillospiraceae bacterium]|nr:helix-turn-helix domain-containing protein [Oscillospiraceae bacterium]